jgi:hypothetical protein
MQKKIITTNDLAIMVAKGFGEMHESFGQIDKRFEQIDKRFDRIENLILADHKRRIDKLESDMKELKNALAI